MYELENKPIVLVKWVDIVADMVWNGEPEPLEPLEFNTVGYLIEEDETKIVICDTLPGIGNRCAFPIGCVISVTHLESY
jgi:hypothetical protein